MSKNKKIIKAIRLKVVIFTDIKIRSILHGRFIVMAVLFFGWKESLLLEFDLDTSVCEQIFDRKNCNNVFYVSAHLKSSIEVNNSDCALFFKLDI